MEETKYAIIDVDCNIRVNSRDNGLLFTEAECEQFEGTGDNVVIVKKLDDPTERYELELTCYYDSYGVFKMECTNKLNIALEIFAAALKRDTELN